MPTYQYRCTECGHDLEAVQKFTDASLTECPNCRGQLRKVFNAVGVVFKGSGFYRNDSRSADAKNGDGSNGESATKIKTETKVEAGSTNGKSDSGSSGTGTSDSGSSSKSDTKQPATAGAAPSSTGAKTG